MSLIYSTLIDVMDQPSDIGLNEHLTVTTSIASLTHRKSLDMKEKSVPVPMMMTDSANS